MSLELLVASFFFPARGLSDSVSELVVDGAVDVEVELFWEAGGMWEKRFLISGIISHTSFSIIFAYAFSCFFTSFSKSIFFEPFVS